MHLSPQPLSGHSSLSGQSRGRRRTCRVRAQTRLRAVAAHAPSPLRSRFCGLRAFSTTRRGRERSSPADLRRAFLSLFRSGGSRPRSGRPSRQVAPRSSSAPSDIALCFRRSLPCVPQSLNLNAAIIIVQICTAMQGEPRRSRIRNDSGRTSGSSLPHHYLEDELPQEAFARKSQFVRLTKSQSGCIIV